MRKIEYAREFRVGQQIAWTYPGEDSSRVGPLAGRVVSVGEEIRIERERDFSVFFPGDDLDHPDAVSVYILEEAPIVMFEVPGDVLNDLAAAVEKPRDMKGYKDAVVRAAEIVLMNTKQVES